ncbi:MAG: hypothetical protein QOH36_845 [Actinomycetota bacterium]|nr:hypothetical protein [Actinomycetota bacterium]
MKALANAPIGTLRELLFRICVMALVCTVWLARTWAGAIFGTLIFVMALVGGRAAQLRAEQDGRVEQERLQQEKFRSKVHGWAAGTRIMFFLFVLGFLAWMVFDLFAA